MGSTRYFRLLPSKGLGVFSRRFDWKKRKEIDCEERMDKPE